VDDSTTTLLTRLPLTMGISSQVVPLKCSENELRADVAQISFSESAASELMLLMSGVVTKLNVTEVVASFDSPRAPISCARDEIPSCSTGSVVKTQECETARKIREVIPARFLFVITVPEDCRTRNQIADRSIGFNSCPGLQPGCRITRRQVRFRVLCAS